MNYLELYYSSIPVLSYQVITFDEKFCKPFVSITKNFLEEYKNQLNKLMKEYEILKSRKC